MCLTPRRAVPLPTWNEYIPTLAPDHTWGSFNLTWEELLVLPVPYMLAHCAATADQNEAMRNHISVYKALPVDESIHLGVAGDIVYLVDNGAAFAALELLPARTLVRVSFRHVNDYEGALAAYGEVALTGRQRVATPSERARFVMQVFEAVGEIRGEPAKVLESVGVDKRRVAEVRFIYESILDELRSSEGGSRGKFIFFSKLVDEVAGEDIARAVAASRNRASSGLRVKLTWDMITMKELWRADHADRERGLAALLSAIRGGREFNRNDMRDALRAPRIERNEAPAGAASVVAAAQPEAAPSSRPRRGAAAQASQLMTAQLTAERLGVARDRAATRDVALARALAESKPGAKAFATAAKLIEAIESADAEELKCGICLSGPEEDSFYEVAPDNQMLAFGCPSKVCGKMCRECIIKHYTRKDTCPMCKAKVKMQVLVLSQKRKRGE